MRVSQEVGNVVLAAGKVIIDTEHVVALGAQALAEMRTEKPGAAGNQDPFQNSAHRSIL
jgi:hypothetical protein